MTKQGSNDLNKGNIKHETISCFYDILHLLAYFDGSAVVRIILQVKFA